MSWRAFILVLLIAQCGCDCRGPDPVPPKPDTPPPAPFGRFEGAVNATFGEDGRTMTLTADFVYIDPREKKWLAPKGAVIDGASIPKAFWSVIGGPFEGKYRKASVVHDVGCDKRDESWQAVHRMFYEACMCGEVPETKAKLMYWAVYHFGPRWREVSEVRIEDGQKKVVTRAVPIQVPAPDAELVNKAEEYFNSKDPSIDEIEKLEPKAIELSDG